MMKASSRAGSVAPQLRQFTSASIEVGASIRTTSYFALQLEQFIRDDGGDDVMCWSMHIAMHHFNPYRY